MIQSRSTKFVAISCMVVLSACSSVRVQPLTASNNAIVGSYPYSLARTSLTLTISVSLTSCGAVQAGPPRIVDKKKVYDFRPVLGLTEPIAVVPTFEGDPGQVYDVPYDQLRRVFGKETKITVTRNANGTLSGINGTVNDQYGPGTVAAVEAAVKVAAGIMIPPVGVAETVTTLAKGGLMGAGSGYGLRKKSTIYHKPPSFCTDAVMTALSEIDAKSQDAAAQAAKDAKDKVTVASPNIAKDQAEIARLQAENRLTKTVRLVWTPAGDEKPHTVRNGYAILQRTVDIYRGAIHDWLSPAGQEWFDETIKPTKTPVIPLSEPARMAALAVTQPIMMQLEMRQFTMGGALPHGNAKKIDEANPTQEQPAGIVIRDPAQGFVRLCHGECSIPGPGIQETGGEIAAPAAVAMGQFGRMVVVHLKNRIFENSEFSVSVNADGSIASIGNHTSGTLAAGLGTLGDTGTAAVTDAAAYNTALAAKNTNTVNRSALVETVNKNLADCYTQQEAVRKAGGVPIGTCG